MTNLAQGCSRRWSQGRFHPQYKLTNIRSFFFFTFPLSHMEILKTAATSLPVSNQYFKASLDVYLGQRNNSLHRFNILLAPMGLSAQSFCLILKVWVRTSTSCQGHQGSHEGDYLPLTTNWNLGKQGVFVFKTWFIQLKVAWVSVQQKTRLLLCVPLYLLQILAENSLSSPKNKRADQRRNTKSICRVDVSMRKPLATPLAP